MTSRCRVNQGLSRLFSLPPRCPHMSSFIFSLLVIGSLVPVSRRLRARGLGGCGETLLPMMDPTLSRRSFSTWSALYPRAFRRTGQPSPSRAHYRRASSRSAATVRFASTSTLHHLQLFHASTKLPAFGPPPGPRSTPQFLKSPQRLAPVGSSGSRQTLVLAAPEEPLHRRREDRVP